MKAHSLEERRVGVVFWLSLLAKGWAHARSMSRPRTRGVWPLLFAAAILGVSWVFPLVWELFLLGIVSATAALFLHQLIEPSRLFWAAPWEAFQLVRSRRARINHIWLHRTQQLLREIKKERVIAGGAASAAGFFLVAEGISEEEVRSIAEVSWRPQPGEFSRALPVEGCNAVGILLTIWFVAGGLLTLTVAGALNLPQVFFCMVIGGAVGHALAGKIESVLFSWADVDAQRRKEVGLSAANVEQIELPGFLWFKDSPAFWVSRIEQGLMQRSEPASGNPAFEVTCPKETVRRIDSELPAGNELEAVEAEQQLDMCELSARPTNDWGGRRRTWKE